MNIYNDLIQLNHSIILQKKHIQYKGLSIFLVPKGSQPASMSTVKTVTARSMSRRGQTRECDSFISVAVCHSVLGCRRSALWPLSALPTFRLEVFYKVKQHGGISKNAVYLRVYYRN